MFKICLFISVTVAIVSNAVDFHEYRNIATCEGRPQTFWIYRELKAAEPCDNVIQKELTAIEKKRILDYHNKLRQKVAKGEETRGSLGPQPAATEMPELEWDDELAELAQRWVQQCNFEQDQCRDVKRFRVNQLIGKYEANGDFISYDVQNLINKWYDDVETIDAKIISNYSLVGKQNSYTQIVWAETTQIGCGGIKHRIPNMNRFFLVCNYGPGGNIVGKSVYKIC